MGASYSQPTPEELADAALYPEAALAELKEAFKKLADSSGTIPAAGAFSSLRGTWWPRLFQMMCQLDQPPSSGGPLRWPAFLAGLTRLCKAPKSHRVNAMTNLYLGVEAGLGDEAVLQLLRDASLASRAGEDPDGVEALNFDAVLADVRFGVSFGQVQGRITPERWATWVALNLPGLPPCMEAFVLEQLFALGRAAPGAAVAEAGALSGAMRAFQAPLLELAKMQAEALLDETGALLLGMAIGPNQEGDTRAWRCLYSSADHGLSMNRFVAHATGYAGPTILLARTDQGEVFGAHVDAPWKAGDKYFGGRDTFLFTLAPAFHVYRPTAISSNYAFFNPPATGQLRGATYPDGRLPEVVGFGGQPVRLRLSLEDDLNQLRWHHSCTSFARHPEEGVGDLPEGVRKVLRLELWGCGGADAEAAQQLLKQRRDRDAARAAKVDRVAMFGGGGDWRDGVPPPFPSHTPPPPTHPPSSLLTPSSLPRLPHTWSDGPHAHIRSYPCGRRQPRQAHPRNGRSAHVLLGPAREAARAAAQAVIASRVTPLSWKEKK